MPLTKQFSILFVEDSEVDKELAEREMIKNGLKFISKRVETEEEYIEKVLKDKPDIIISDYSLPKFNGMSALRIALKMKLGIPFILITGSRNEETAVECIKAGADDYILKDNLNRLVPALLAAVEKHQNIKSKRIAEKELAKSERRFRILFSENLAPMILIDPDSQLIVDANKAAEKFYGWNISQLREKKIDDINTLSSEEIKKEINNALTRKRIQFNFQHRRAYKDIRDVEVFSSSIIIGGKKLIHSIIHDVTEKKIIENELAAYRENLEVLVKERTYELDAINKQLKENLEEKKILEAQLEESLLKEREINELKSRFIATVSHEFRTPLTALYSTVQMIERYSQNWSEVKIKEHYLQIESTINYLTELLDDVLSVSKVDQEIIKCEISTVNIKYLINSFITEVKAYDHGNHDIMLSFDSCCEMLETDHKLLRHSVVNLLSNAVKYSPKKSPVYLRVLVENDTLKIIVEDKGIGIPENEIKHIFEAFYRTNNSVGVQGTGLGLKIVKRSIEVLGGSVSVESKLNEGSRFVLIIPVRCL